MDPSFSVSTDPHNPPPQFAPFPSFAALFGAPPPSSNHHVAQAPLNPEPAPPPAPAPLPPHPSFNHPPYADMICAAIAALNEPDGSSKKAISRYIERVYAGLPPAHAAFLTHHLKTLKNSGVLVMIKKSYKLASGPPSGGVPAVAPTPEASRSNLLNTNNQSQSDFSAGSSAPLKRGRGRPPKPKPETLAGAQPNAAEPTSVDQSNGQHGADLNSGQLNLSASGSAEESQVAKRRPGRPRKDGSQPAVQAAPSSAGPAVLSSGVTKRRGRPPGRKGPGRPRKPKSVFPYATNGPRRRGRPKRSDSAAGVAPTVAEDGEVVAPTPGKRRGRPPKIGGVISKPMKPIRSSGRPVGRPRKNANWATTGAPEPQTTAAYEELERKLEFFQDKVKQAVGVLRSQVATENSNAMSAINELEGLVAMDINEPPVQEAWPHEPEPEPRPPPLPQSEREAEAETRVEAEAIEALF